MAIVGMHGRPHLLEVFIVAAAPIIFAVRSGMASELIDVDRFVSLSRSRWWVRCHSLSQKYTKRDTVVRGKLEPQ
jgi:hypothetical protein